MKKIWDKYIFLLVSIVSLLAFSSAASFSVSTQSEWNKGTFNGTSADRSDNSAVLGLGYLNGSASGQPNQDSLNNDSLVGYWRMDGTSGSVTDYSGNNYDGTTNNFEGDERGVSGTFKTSSFDFDGSDDYVTTTNNQDITNNFPFAISLWVYDKGQIHSPYNTLMGTYNGAIGGNGFLVFIENRNPSDWAPSFYYNGGDGSVDWVYAPASSWNQDQWNHIVVVKTGSGSSNQEIYVNGAEYSSSASNDGASEVVSDDPPYLGYQPGMDREFQGKIDEVRMYNRGLSNASIQKLYNRGRDGTFNGNYTSPTIENDKKRSWDTLNVDLTSLPTDTAVDAKFSALDSDGNLVDSEIIELSQGDNNYSLSVSDSVDARVSFNGTSTNASRSWEISSYTVYQQVFNRGDYVHTLKKETDKPRSFFGNNTGVTIRTTGSFFSNPTVTVTDSQGNTHVDSASMTNLSGVYEYNYSLNGSTGWYDVKINGITWENVFYQGEKWQNNFTDADGNVFSFRRELNVSEPGVGDRWFVPVDRNVDFTFSPDNDSIRVVSWNGIRMLEIPSQLYNVSKSGEAVSNANVVFLSTMNQSENRTYYVMSSKSEFSKTYSGLNNTDTGLDNKTENAYFRTYFNQSLGGLMRDTESKVGTGDSLVGSEPMDFFPELDVGLTNFKARIDNTAEINISEGPLLTEISVSGNLNDDDSKPYTVDCSVYAANPYMLCEKNVTAENSETWSNFYLNGLIGSDGKFSYISYENSSDNIVSRSLTDGDGTDYTSLDSDMRWISLYNNDTGDSIAELYLEKDFGPTESPAFQVFDDSSNDYFRQRVISSGTSVSSGDSYYTKTARVFYNGLRGADFPNKLYKRLKNPVNLSEGSEVTNDNSAANYSSTGNVSSNDSSSVKVFSYWSDDTFLDYAEINITGNGVNGSNTELYYNDSYEIRDSGDFTNTSWVNVTLENSTVNAGEISANISVFDVSGKSNSTLVEFNVSDSTPPEYSNIVNKPNNTPDLDPGNQINITANITEYSNISQAFLYYKNDSASNFSRKLTSRESETDFVHKYKSNFTPGYEDNYTYYLSANDTLDQVRNSSRTNLTVEWDYTWNFDPNLSGQTDTFNQNVSIGNLTINNTGDFDQSFRFSTGVFNSRTWVNGSRLPASFEVGGNGSTRFFSVNATTRDSTSTEGLDSFKLTVENESASPDTNFSSFDVTTSTGGPFLFTEITEYNSTVTQGDKNVKLTAETTNKGNESANIVNITFKLPNSWKASSGESLKSPNTLALAIGTSKTFTTKFDIPSDASTGTKTIEAVAKSQETNRTTTVQVTVEKKQSSNNQQESSSGGGGGGSGSSNTGGSGLSSSQQRKLFQTEETYEIVRGEDQKFILTVENPFKEGELENVRVNVSGFLSQYLSVEPSNIDKIGVNQSKNFSINIEAPRYFSRGEYSLNFNITGINNRSQTYTAGNQTYLTKDIQKFKENRKVELIVHEISKEKASEALNQSREAVKELKNQGVMNTETRELISEARQALKSGNYQKARSLSQQIQNKRQKAENADQTLQEVQSLIEEAEYRGLKAPKTERMVSMASTALERGDYSMAANRAEEAKNLYALETKGEINYLNYTKRNWQKLGLGLILLIGFSTGGFLRFRLFRIKRKLSKLEEEEETLLGLMKQVQRESFEEGKMSMEEYEEAMMQYEKQLSQNVKNTVRLESRKAHWKNIRKGRKRYEHERDRIEDLMQETQKRYLEEGEIETRVYKQKMQSFRERLTELEGKLAEMEAQKEIKEETGLRNYLPGLPNFLSA